MVGCPMKAFLAGLKGCYRRRFRGVVKPPAHAKGQGTTWQQHPASRFTFICSCGTALAFCQENYVVMSQNHVEGCEGVFDSVTNAPAKGGSRLVDLTPCSCPVTEARYVKICPNCRIGHWKQAK